MPDRQHAALDVRDITLHEPVGGRTALGSLPGVQVVVLLRHRH